jgi:hypothetical protein
VGSPVKTKSSPRLVDLISTWMKKELPKAKHSEAHNEKKKVGAMSTERFTIMKGKRECFYVEITTALVPDPYAYMTIGTSLGSILVESIEIKHDRVIFGKWNSGAEVLAADPEFFQKMAVYMSRAAMVVTMGDFYPNIPEDKDE